MKLAIPTVHMNGTSRAALLEAIETARKAVGAAERAMADVTPNGRDYYPQGPDAISEALRQHANRLHNLRAVSNELGEIGESIA